MTIEPRRFAIFESALTTAFLEEIVGEAFFLALARDEPDLRRAATWDKLALVELAADPAPCASRDRYLARVPA